MRHACAVSSLLRARALRCRRRLRRCSRRRVLERFALPPPRRSVARSNVMNHQRDRTSPWGALARTAGLTADEQLWADEEPRMPDDQHAVSLQQLRRQLRWEEERRVHSERQHANTARAELAERDRITAKNDEQMLSWRPKTSQLGGRDYMNIPLQDRIPYSSGYLQQLWELGSSPPSDWSKLLDGAGEDVD